MQDGERATRHAHRPNRHPCPPRRTPPPQAAAYIEEHKLQKTVEDVINLTIKAKPEDPFTFMVSGRLDARWARASR